MRKLMSVLIVTISSSPLFAGETADFERGFNACQALHSQIPAEFVVCTIPGMPEKNFSAESEVKKGKSLTAILEENYNARFIKALLESGKEIPCITVKD